MRTKLIVLLCLIFAANPAIAERAISFPHTEDFTDSDSIDDISWISAGLGATINRVAESWRGGGNYCVKMTPPTSQSSGNGQYCALGKFEFTTTTTVNISFAIYIGTSWSSTASTSAENKFIDVHHSGGTRIGILCINEPVGDHEWGLWHMTTAAIHHYDWYGEREDTILFGDGVGSTDYAGEWLWINYIISASTQEIYMYDRNGDLTGEYFSITNNASQSPSEFYIGGYYNSWHPSPDSNTYILLDDLVIQNGSSPQSPPSGFTDGSEDPTPAVSGVSGVGVHFSN
jgi:hypothetical protein